MTAQEYIDACNECDNAQRAAELLRIGVQLAEDDIRVRDIAERMKTTIERERATIKQYAEQVERLKAEIEDLTAELEDKRIQLTELGSLSALIGRLGVQVVRLEQTDKPTAAKEQQKGEPTAADKQQDKPTAVKNQLSKKVDSKKSKSKASGFDEFWTAYPKKVDKTKSREIWQKLAPDATLKKRIIAAVKQQAKSDEWTKDGGQFVPYPSTWLRRRRWEDEPTTPTVTESGDGVHSYDVDKILKYAKKNIPELKGDNKK